VSKTIGSSFFCPHGCPVPFESIRGLSTHLHHQHKNVKQQSEIPTTTRVLNKVEQQKHLTQQQRGGLVEQKKFPMNVEQKQIEVKGAVDGNFEIWSSFL
jgi:hypothetical protein